MPGPPDSASPDSSFGEHLAAVLWPLGKAPPERLSSWRTACVLLTIPLTGAVHHLFQEHRCILNLNGSDYNLPALRQLFLHDPSLPWAIVTMIVVYHLGKGAAWLRRAAVPAFTAFIPLSIWLWDIPFTGRLICRTFHDRRFHLAPGVPLGTRWIYCLCFLIYGVFQAILLLRNTPQSAVTSLVETKLVESPETGSTSI